VQCTPGDPLRVRNALGLGLEQRALDSQPLPLSSLHHIVVHVGRQGNDVVIVCRERKREEEEASR
jgi:hypothetical protein